MSQSDSPVHLGIFATHPIQYQLPWFRALNDQPDLELTVLFKTLPSPERQGRGFDTEFEWDLPLLEGYEWKVLRNQKNSSLEAKRTARAFLETLAFDLDVALISGWNDLFLVGAGLAAKARGLPLLLRGESNALNPRPRYVDVLHRMHLSLFDGFLAIGESNRRFYRNHGVEPGRIFRAPYFVDNDRFDRDYRSLKPRKEELRASWDIPAEAVCFLFAGKFVDKKRPLDVLRAFSRLSGRYDDVHLLMVGDGPRFDDCRRFASEEGLPVTFTGFLNQTEIGRAYAAGDVLVLPSNYGETWGLVVNEAMVFEVPVIVSDRVGSGPDLVRQKDTGFVVPYGDLDALEGRMRRMVEEPDERRRMGGRARELVTTQYNLEKHVNGTLEAVRYVCPER